jgi:hypothetical protein
MIELNNIDPPPADERAYVERLFAQPGRDR